MKREYDFSQSKRGAVVPVPAGKTRVTIPLDNDILQWFRSQVHEMGGGNYQTLINAALREHIRQREESLEETLRRVIREEMQTQA
ncbi:MAG: BrnA antitoxin family protein [Thermodesulfobacteriota bacterium]